MTVKEIQGDLITVKTLEHDFTALGLQHGMTVIVHSSLKSLAGWVAGGSAAVILALENVLGNEGTLIMPTHTGDLSDPAGWANPPVRESWWEPIRQTMPAFEPDLIPSYGMGIIPECFRKQNGVLRSSHPQVSFAAWGANANPIIGNHSLDYGLGESSPLARIYDASGWVLLLGVGNGNNTSLHLAEYRANYPSKKEIKRSSPMMINGERTWVSFKDNEYDTSDFEKIGEHFEAETGLVRRGKIAGSTALFLPQKTLVDYAVQWMEKNRS